MDIEDFKKAKCPLCGSKLILEKVKEREIVIGDCSDRNCKKSWVLYLGEKKHEIMAKEATKIGNLKDLGYKGPKGLPVFEVSITNFKFFDEKFVREDEKKAKIDWSKVDIIPCIENIEFNETWNNNERKIDFHFKLETNPHIICISFNGQCILESPEQRKIEVLLKQRIQIMNKMIYNDILKTAYLHADVIGKNNNIPLHPIGIVLKKYELK